MTTNDQIIKNVVLRAPRERVWKAISEADRFGTWFGVDFDGPFESGKRATGRITPTKMDAAIAKSQEPFEGRAFDIVVERIEPMSHFSFRWHPAAIDECVDYSDEPTTLVTFELEDHDDGTHLTITESGFDAVPLERRAKAFEMNRGGWEAQAQLIAAYVHQAA
ncbi:MAG: SRPBCC family protein [Polyangiaceae bacterium]